MIYSFKKVQRFFRFLSTVNSDIQGFGMTAAIFEVMQNSFQKNLFSQFVSLCFYSLSSKGKMSDARAVRKQQQLNNLVAMVMEMARPGQTVVDFCSGGVDYFVTFEKIPYHSFFVCITQYLFPSHVVSCNL